jgi:hypothetical protein
MKLTIVAVGQHVPDWAQTAYDDYAKRFPPELKVELKAVKTEPRGSKTLETLYAAERKRIEAAIPRGTRIVVLDERGTNLTTKALAQRLRAGSWRATMWPWSSAARRAGPEFKAGRPRAHPPVRPDPAACHGARAADRAALPRLVGQCRPSLPPRISPAIGPGRAPISPVSVRRARAFVLHRCGALTRMRGR